MPPGVALPPSGVVQVPSPRQYVVFDAPVPLFKRLTERFPIAAASGTLLAFVRSTAVGVPRFGVTSTGEVARHSRADPFVGQRRREIGARRRSEPRPNPVPSPDTPVPIGNPVAFVSVAALGTPRFGVTSVGEVAKTAAPEPVSSVSAAVRLALRRRCEPGRDAAAWRQCAKAAASAVGLKIAGNASRRGTPPLPPPLP